MRAVSTSGKSLAQWRDELVLLPQALVNIEVADKSKIESPEAQAFIEKEMEHLGEGRLLIRASGTEPLVRVMVEASDAQIVAERIADELKELLHD